MILNKACSELRSLIQNGCDITEVSVDCGKLVVYCQREVDGRRSVQHKAGGDGESFMGHRIRYVGGGSKLMSFERVEEAEDDDDEDDD